MISDKLPIVRVGGYRVDSSGARGHLRRRPDPARDGPLRAGGHVVEERAALGAVPPEQLDIHRGCEAWPDFFSRCLVMKMMHVTIKIGLSISAKIYEIVCFAKKKKQIFK